MTIGEIIERSEKIDQFCKGCSINWPKENIFGTLEWNSEAGNDIMSDVLYVVSVNDLPKALPGNSVYNFLLHSVPDDGELKLPEIIRRRCNILTTVCPAKEAMNRMEKIIFNERKVESAMRRITEAMFVSGMKKMIAVGSEQIHAPIILSDSNGKILERYKGNYVEFTGSGMDALWEQTDFAEQLLEMAAQCSMESEEMQHYQKVPGAKVFRLNEKRKLIAMAIPVRVSKIEVGKIFGFLMKSRDLALEEELLYRLAQIVGDDLQKHNHFHVNRRQRYVNFMWMLLEGKYPNLQAIERAMEEFEITFKGRCRVALLHIIHDSEEVVYENEMLNVLSSQVQAKLPELLSVIHNQDLVLVFNMSEKEDISEYEKNVLLQMAEVNHLSVGISHSFDTLTSLRQLYWQAKEAAEFGHDILHQNYTEFSEVSHFSMMRLVQQNMDCMSLVDPKLKDLYFSPKDNMKEYFFTLYYYLKYDGNTNAVSQKTHVHRNTVLYRIDKLQDKMGFLLNDGMTKMKLLLSFEILKYLKLFQPED